jgi:uncharacterized membrane protein
VKQSTPWIVALLVSVLINGGLAGFILHRTADGPAWRVSQSGPPAGGDMRRGGAGRFNVRGFIHALPEEHRRAAQERMRSEADVMRDLMRTAHEARVNAEAVLAAEPFDDQAVREALAEMRSTRLAAEAHIEGVVIEIVADLDNETRNAALRAGRQGPRGDRRPRGRRRDDHF